MSSFTDFIALRVVCHNRNRSNVSSVEEELKSMVVKFGTIIMNTSYRAWIATEPRVFEGITASCPFFFGIEQISTRLVTGSITVMAINSTLILQDFSFQLPMVNSTRFFIPTPNGVPMNFLPGH